MGQNDIVVKDSLAYNARVFWRDSFFFESQLFDCHNYCHFKICIYRNSIIYYVCHIMKRIYLEVVYFFFFLFSVQRLEWMLQTQMSIIFGLCFAHTQILYGTFRTDITTTCLSSQTLYVFSHLAKKLGGRPAL